ncbi:hypothetical protein JW756_03705 [Candidatus Woesearchaeota archaeon]|nr:hypothetical protein [Candidatus Woesearchaeota archaeon]
MMLSNPAADFFVKAAIHAKEARMSELNTLEAELIILGEQILAIKSQGVYVEKLARHEKSINEMKTIIRNKKSEL